MFILRELIRARIFIRKMFRLELSSLRFGKKPRFEVDVKLTINPIDRLYREHGARKGAERSREKLHIYFESRLLPQPQ